MIHMWLGSFILMMWGMTAFQKQVGLLVADFQRAIFEKGFSSSMVKMFAQAVAVDVVEASPQRAAYSAMGLLNLRILTTRPAVLLMCLSPLAVLPVLGLSSLFLGFSGYFILGLFSVSLFKFWKSKHLDHSFQILFAAGVFLVGAESLMRNARILQTTLTDADLIFFVADGRFGAVLTLMLLAFVISLLIQVEFWTLVLGLSLLSTGTISFNGALGLLLGERLAFAALYWWRTKGLNQECKKLGLQFAALVVVTSIIGFWWAGEARTFLDLGFSLETTASQEKTGAFLLLFSLILAVQLLAALVWGHFAGNNQTEEMQNPHYISASWLERGLLSEGQRSWAKDRVQKRLSEIRYHLAGLKSLKEGQVPDHIQARIVDEESQLSKLQF